jgi:regulator of replication initiation timing
VCGLGIKERNFYEKNKRNDMVDKNKEAIRIEVDHTKVDDRGPLDLTRQVDETDKRIKELDNSLSIALEINDKFQRENKKLTDKVRKAEAMRRPLDTMDEIAYRELEKENADLKWDNKSLAKQVEDLKWDNKSLAKQVEDKVEEVKALKMKLEELDSNKD